MNNITDVCIASILFDMRTYIYYNNKSLTLNKHGYY